MIRNRLSMYFGRRRPLHRSAGVAAAALLVLAASPCAGIGTAGASTPGHRAAGLSPVASAGQVVSGLTLTVTRPPSPLPVTLPAGHAYRPPPGRVLQGVADQPVSAYQSLTGRHPAVYQAFIAWGQWLPGITQDATRQRARLMMMVGTRFGARNMISPEGIATGAGDPWLIGLAQQIFASHDITYLRLMAEMNNCNNAYAADNCDGSSRGPAYSAAAFRQAWRRVTLIMRGGLVSLIDRELAALRLPPLRTSLRYLPTPRVAMAWVPMVGGSPDVPGLAPSVYYPGRRWVDWVGTDFYSRYPNWTGLSSFYRAYARTAPFVFGEYAIWGGDDPSWARTLFGWVRTHPATRMMVYNDASPDFWLTHFPASAGVIRSELASPRFLSYAPEWARRAASASSRTAKTLTGSVRPLTITSP